MPLNKLDSVFVAPLREGFRDWRQSVFELAFVAGFVILLPDNS